MTFRRSKKFGRSQENPVSVTAICRKFILWIFHVTAFLHSQDPTRTLFRSLAGCVTRSKRVIPHRAIKPMQRCSSQHPMLDRSSIGGRPGWRGNNSHSRECSHILTEPFAMQPLQLAVGADQED